MTEPDPNKPKKIIVDEDWKSQVAAEKEQMKEQKDAPEEKDSAGTEMPIPDASFSLLATTLTTQALAAMGQIPTPEGENQEVPVNLDLAKHCIDTLAVLDEKTKGNLTPDEEKLLAGFLHELRMTFVAVQNRMQS